MVKAMLEQLIRSALKEYAQQQKFPEKQKAQSVTDWIRQKDKGRC